MGKFIISNLLFLFLTLHLLAQHGNRVMGIYKTSIDFKDGKLFYSNNCGIKKNRIKLNDFLNKSYITVKQNDTIYKLSKKILYGYKTCKNQIFRFNNKKELLLLNAGLPILIYIQLNTKIHEGARINITNKYFSTDSNSTLKELTIKNLKEAYIGNLKFQKLIDINFKYNMDLGEIDNTTHVAKINMLLRQSL